MNLSTRITKSITNYENTNSIGFKFRSKRIQPFIQMIEKAYTTYGKVNIIDIGGRKIYWKVLPPNLLETHKVTITIINLSDLQESDEPHFRFRHGDGCDLSCFPDQSFHIVHSNSVIEHVGDWPHMVKFAKEVKRLAPHFFVQTPYFWFPIEPHFMMICFHWLPRPLQIWMLLHWNLGNHLRSSTVDEAASKLEHYRLLDRQMLTELFPDAQMISERFFGVTKSLTVIQSHTA